MSIVTEKVRCIAGEAYSDIANAMTIDVEDYFQGELAGVLLHGRW